MAKHRAESARQFDVWRMVAAGCLQPGASGVWSWYRDGEQVASIGYCAHEDALWVSYTMTRCGDTIPYSYWIPLLMTRMRRGSRVWFGCPHCGRRCQKLYLPSGAGRYLCRVCHDLSYETRQERTSLGIWAFRKERELERKLEAIPRDGAHHRRYWKIIDEIERLQPRQLASLRRFAAGTDRMFARWGAATPNTMEAAATVVPKHPRGRPKERRMYTRRAPLVLATPVGERRVYCVKCRDRRPLSWPYRVTLSNGRPAICGRCKACSTKLVRLVAAP